MIGTLQKVWETMAVGKGNSLKNGQFFCFILLFSTPDSEHHNISENNRVGILYSSAGEKLTSVSRQARRTKRKFSVKSMKSVYLPEEDDHLRAALIKRINSTEFDVVSVPKF
jgi:hypothetical protein